MPPKVDKEAVYFLASAGKHPFNGDPGYFEKAKEVMTLIIEKKIFLRDHDEVGIMLAAHTDDNGEDNNTPTQIFCDNHIPTWKTVKNVQKLKKSDKIFDDWISALTNTLQHIEENMECKESFNQLILILLFDCHSNCPGIKNINMQDIAQSIQQLGIQLLWIGSKPLNDLPDEELNMSEKVLMKILKLVDGKYMAVDETLPSLRIFKKLKSRFIAWKCDFELGQFRIPIAMYNQAVRPLKTTTFQTIRTETVDGVEKSVVMKPEREYVDRYKNAHAMEDTISGYMYGRQCIPVPEADKAGMDYKGGTRSFKLFGFVPRNAINLEDISGDTSRIVIPQSPESARLLYCLAQAMKDADRVALVRRIYNLNNCPKMGFLFPHLDLGEPWGFMYIELLYADERRGQQSSELISVKNRLTKEKENVVGNLIDSMVLTSSDNEPEPFCPGDVPAPGLQHLYNCLIQRALNSDKPIPEMDENLKKLIELPESIKINSEPVKAKVRALFPIRDEPITTEKSVETAAEIPVQVKELVKDEKMECVSLAEENNVDLDELFAEDM